MRHALVALASAALAVASPPNIVVIVADDLGWHDCGFTGSNISTPHIDRIATEGVRLVDYYGQPVCTPSRAAMLTGRYPIAYGLQTYVIDPPGVDYGLPLNETLLPQLLKQYGGYQTRAVGKWHLGMSRWEYTPTYRGFDSFHGFYSGGQDYFTHIESGAFDLHVDSQPNCGPGCSVVDWGNKGTFSTYLYASSAVDVITRHDPSQGPLFLYLPFQAVHSPDEVPQSYIDPYVGKIPPGARRTFAGMLSALDEGIGNVTAALEAAGLADNTLIWFTADNGGPISEPGCGGMCGDATGATNWPLRGGKHSLWEGGVRMSAAVWGRMLSNTGVNRTGLMHHVDLLPTIMEAAGITLPAGSTLPLHGSSQWSMVVNGSSSSRQEVLLNIDPLQAQPFALGNYSGNAAMISTQAPTPGKWKLQLGMTGPPWGHMPESPGPHSSQKGEDEEQRSAASAAVDPATGLPLPGPLGYVSMGSTAALDTALALGLEVEEQADTATVATAVTATSPASQVGPRAMIGGKVVLPPGSSTTGGYPAPALWPLRNMTTQLYNLDSDPYETTDVSGAYPAVVAYLLGRIQDWATHVQVLPLYWNATVDPASNPALRNGTWTPWL